MKKDQVLNKQIVRSRELVFNALMALMDDSPFQDIKISNITEQAGVARATFYRNFSSKEDIVMVYLEGTFEEMIARICEEERENTLNIILTIFTGMEKHKPFLKKLLSHGLASLILDQFDQFEEGLLRIADRGNVDEDYILKFQVGGFYRIFVDWISEKDALDAEEVGRLTETIIAPYGNLNAFKMLHDYSTSLNNY